MQEVPLGARRNAFLDITAALEDFQAADTITLARLDDRGIRAETTLRALLATLQAHDVLDDDVIAMLSIILNGKAAV